MIGLFEGHVSHMTPTRSTGNAKEMIIMADQTAQNEKIKEVGAEPTKKSAVDELSDLYDADVILAPE